MFWIYFHQNLASCPQLCVIGEIRLTVILTDEQRVDLFVCVSVCMESQIFNDFYFNQCAHYVHEDP